MFLPYIKQRPFKVSAVLCSVPSPRQSLYPYKFRDGMSLKCGISCFLYCWLFESQRAISCLLCCSELAFHWNFLLRMILSRPWFWVLDECSKTYYRSTIWEQKCDVRIGTLMFDIRPDRTFYLSRIQKIKKRIFKSLCVFFVCKKLNLDRLITVGFNFSFLYFVPTLSWKTYCRQLML